MKGANIYMEIIGVIAEYNPFHNGHLYQLNKIKEMYPDSIIILVLNGYFLERGIISLETKEEKTRLALKYGVNLVIELPFIFGSNSADIFAEASLELLNALKISKLIFGSESNDINTLKSSASKQLKNDFDDKVKRYMDLGVNYPTALNKATGIDINKPNDLLGVSYIKTILKHDYKIEVETIKRTNDFHDLESNERIISASNIREKLKNNTDVKKYIPEGNLVSVNEDLFFNLLKYKIITSVNLDEYLSVDEGLDSRLKKVISKSSNLDELIQNVKTKRYTYNRIMRMFIHILIGVKKRDKESILKNEYLRILGLDPSGQKYVNSIKKELGLPLVSKFTGVSSKIKDYELKASEIYKILTNTDVMQFEYQNKPIIKEK